MIKTPSIGTNKLLLKGIIHYQNHQILYENPDNFDNVFFCKDGYIAEKGFLRSFDQYFKIIIGVEEEGFSSGISNINDQETLNSTSVKNRLYSPSAKKPSIGSWHIQESQTTLLYREPFGSIPLYYIHLPGKFLAFSTDLNDISKNKLIQSYLSIDIDRVATYLSIDLRTTADISARTFFKHIKTVPPGHIISANTSGIHHSCHLDLNPSQWSDLQSTGEYYETLKSVLTKSLQHSVGNPNNLIGSHLSGGLDSSSISSLFKKLFPDRDLHTFHIRANNLQSDESYFSNIVAKQIGSIHHEIAQSTNDLELLKLSTKIYGQPEISFLSPASNLKTFATASQVGCKILLSGHGGDSVIGNGMELYQQAYDSKDWKLLKSLIKKRIPYYTLTNDHPTWHQYTEEKKFQVIIHNFVYPRLIDLIKNNPRQVPEFARELSSNFDLNILIFSNRVLKGIIQRLTSTRIPVDISLLKNEFIRYNTGEINSLQITRNMRGSLDDKYQELIDDVFHPQIIRGQEQHFALSNYYGISKRAPFMNLELLELNMAIPDVVKYGNGIGRAHLREAMKDIIPKVVEERSTKASLSSPDGLEMTSRLLEQSRDYLMESSAIWDIIDIAKFSRQVRVFKNTKIPVAMKSQSFFHITRAISLACWLEEIKK